MSTLNGRWIPEYYQTSCFCPATRLAGRNGSCLAVVEDIAREMKGWARESKHRATLSLKAFRSRRSVDCLQLEANIGRNLLHCICNHIKPMAALPGAISRLNLGGLGSANAVGPIQSVLHTLRSTDHSYCSCGEIDKISSRCTLYYPYQIPPCGFSPYPRRSAVPYLRTEIGFFQSGEPNVRRCHFPFKQRILFRHTPSPIVMGCYYQYPVAKATVSWLFHSIHDLCRSR